MKGLALRWWLAAAAIVVPFRVASSGEGGARVGEPPRENSSYVPDDDEGLRKALQAVQASVDRKDWPAAVNGLQRIAEGPKDQVVAVAEAGVFEGARTVAHLRIVALGATALSAYEREFGARAREMLEAGVSRRDPALLRHTIDLYLPSAAGRRASLLLADLALEQGDDDASLGCLERLEDLEEVAAPDLADEVRAWRTARIDREAAVLAASPAAFAHVRAWLSTPGAKPPAEAELRAPRSSPDWPTAGGDASRARVIEPLGKGVQFVANEALSVTGPALDATVDPDKGHAKRPSPWLPPRAVVSGGKVYASDGRFLHVRDLATQQPLVAPIPLTAEVAEAPLSPVRGTEARRRWGWIEGHGLTVSGDVVYAYVPAVRLPPQEDDAPSFLPRGRRFPRVRPPPPESDHVVAVRVGEKDGRVLWSAGGEQPTTGLPEGLRLFGTPLLYRGALHVAGLRATKATTDRFEAYHVALVPETGEVRSVTFLGAGGPIRRRRDDELIPSSCAGARGRVVVVTSLGVAAAVDADTGHTLWSMRYDRGRPDGDDLGRRLEEVTEQGDRKSSFVNQSPLLSGSLCFLAPSDSRQVFVLHDRPRGPKRLLRGAHVNRTEHFSNLAVEELVGVTTGRYGVPPTLVAVGQGYTESVTETHTCVVGMDPATLAVRWQRALPFGDEPEPFGGAMLTATEVLVPTFQGIAAYEVADGDDLPAFDRASIPKDRESLLDPDEKPFGNLVPVPSRGFLAVNESSISFWLKGR